MATTATGRRLTEQHRAAQARLNALVIVAVRPLWRLLDPDDLAATAPSWIAAVTRLVDARHGASAALARRYFRAFRIAELGRPPAGTLDRPGLDADALATSLMVTGPVRIRRAQRRAEDVGQAVRLGEAASAAAAGRHAISGGRDTVTRAVQADRQALGFARATSGQPCAFCALLAARGPVFGSEETAAFQAHDRCACTAEPVYRRDAPFPGQRFAELYQEQAQGASDQLTAFRRAYEGRSDD